MFLHILSHSLCFECLSYIPGFSHFCIVRKSTFNDPQYVLESHCVTVTVFMSDIIIVVW